MRHDLLPFTEPIRVLDQGHVRLVSVMDDELAVVQAARVSYGLGLSSHDLVADEDPDLFVCKVCGADFARDFDPTDPANGFVDPEPGSPGHCQPADRSLIRYLMRHRHGTPFEMAEMKLHVRIPMDAWRQGVRHRTANVNEYSTRYRPAIDAMMRTEPDAWRLQATSTKQGSSGWLSGSWDDMTWRPDADGAPLSGLASTTPGEYLSRRQGDLQSLAREVYQERLDAGIAREQARSDLPLSNYTELYWKFDLRNLLHFLSLRQDGHAQVEIRAYADAIAEIVKVWAPWTYEAFEDYVLHAHTFSRQEAALLARMAPISFGTEGGVDAITWCRRQPEWAKLSKRERGVFLRAVGVL